MIICLDLVGDRATVWQWRGDIRKSESCTAQQGENNGSLHLSNVIACKGCPQIFAEDGRNAPPPSEASSVQRENCWSVAVLGRPTIFIDFSPSLQST